MQNIENTHTEMYYSCCLNFLLHAAKKNNDAAKFFASLKQNISEGFIGAP